MKKLVIILGSLFGVLLIVLIAGMIVLKSLLTPALLVEQMESAMNLRAEVKELNISLFSIVSSIELKGVKLARRDGYANRATPIAKRPPLKGALIGADAFDLKFSLGPLLKKRFELQKLVLDGARINLVLYKNGGNNLNVLFKTPRIVAGKRNPALDKKPKKKEKPEPQPKKKAAGKPFTVKDLPIAAKLKLIGLRNANINIRMQHTRQDIRISGLTLTVDDIDIDPANLKQHNSAYVKFNTDVTVLGRGKESAKLRIRSGGKVVPFEAKSGRVNPSVVYRLTLAGGSHMNGMALLDQLAGSFPMLSKAGIRIPGVSKRAELTEDVGMTIGYGRGRVTFLTTVKFPTKNYTLTLTKGSWLRTTDNIHTFRGDLLASKAESAKALKGVDARLDRSLAKAKGVNKADVRKQLLGSVVKGDRISLPFVSTGNIKSPRVRLGVQLPSISSLLKGALTGAIKGKVNQYLKKKGGAKAKKYLKKFGF